MIKDKKVLSVIPARGGSKGLPGKNIKKLSGKPLIAYSIEASINSRHIDRTIVSTDDQLISSISKEYGADVPFLRPDKLATDTAKGIDVIKHAVDFFKDKYDIVIVLQPTSPLRTIENIESAFNLYTKYNAKAVVSVCEMEHPVQWSGTLPENLCMKDFIKSEYLNTNRQELERYYRLNGAIYLSDIDYLKQNNTFYGEKTYALIMNKESSIDIDSIIDFRLAEVLLNEEKK